MLNCKFVIILFLILGCIRTINAQEINPNGYNIFYYSNGNISSEGYLVDGKPDGYWRSYYEDETLKSEGYRRFFLLDSIWHFYNPDGHLSQSIYYRNDLRNGYTISYDFFYDEDSVKHYYKSSKELYLNGKREGLSFYYDKNSNIKYSYNYKNDKKHGMGKEYNKDSLVITLFNYYDSYLINRIRINRFNNAGLKQGKWISFHPNGNKHIECNYLNGKLHGDYIVYDLSENVVSEKIYKNGEIYVPSDEDIEEEEIELLAEIKTSYYNDGTIRFQGAFIDTVPVGIHREYDKKGTLVIAKEYNRHGQLLGEGSFDENGLRTGKWRLYDPILNYYYGEGYYKTGKKNGKWVYFYPDKKIEQKGEYIAGIPEKKWIWYYQNGNIKREEFFVNGKLEGEYVEYNIKSDIILKGEYFDDAKQGEWYYNVGNITKKGSYDLNNKIGHWKHIYNDTENLSFEGNFVNGDPDGTHKFYYNHNNNIRMLGTYRMGSKHSHWRKYNEDGSLFITHTYENDRLVRVDGRRIN